MFVIGGVVFAAPHKLRVDPATAKTLVAKGATLIADYGAFSAVEADDSLLVGIDTNNVEVSDDWNLIRLNAKPLDTSTPQVKALRHTLGSFSSRMLHLVQFAGPVKPEWLEALKLSGAQIISYIPENAYLIYGDSPAIARMQSWATNSDYVQWDGASTYDLKVHPYARPGAGENPAVVRAFRDSARFPIPIQIRPRWRSLTGLLQPRGGMFPASRLGISSVSLPSDQLDTIAAQPDVVSILPYLVPKKRDERQDQIVAGNLTENLRTAPVTWHGSRARDLPRRSSTPPGSLWMSPTAELTTAQRLRGTSGFTRSVTPVNPAVLPMPGLRERPTPGGTLKGCDGHGTLNTHIIANYDDFTGFQHQDAEGYSYGVGVCPFVKVGSSVIFDNSSENNDFTNPDYTNMLADAYGSGARVDNNSWGASEGGVYDSEAQTYDALVRDSEQKLSGNHEMVIVFAAGNDGPCVDEQGTGGGVHGIDSPGSAKNVITVGAAENVRSLSIANGGNATNGDDACGESDADANDANDMTCFSSEGPCKDGRMKPDLVAPGIHITGGVPQNTPAPDPSGTGSAIDCFNASGVCALDNSGTTDNTNNFFPLDQQFYTESSGTSHSTPAVSGACALIRQYFINNNWTVPSAAMTKAFLMNSARYMTGTGADDNLWSPSQGMGELDLGMALDGEPRFLRDELSEDMFTATGQIRAYGGVVVDSTHPLRVTVAWTDAPGSTSGAAYKNNLNLSVSIGGKTYWGNFFSGQYSTTGGAADTKDNVQSVFLPAGVSGNFVVTITAANINSEGVPGAGSLSQDFALVVYNGAATNALVYTPAAASYSGLFYESDGPELGKSGAVTLTTTTSRSYSGKLQIGAVSYPFTGTFNALGAATNVISRKGAASLGLMLSVNVTNTDFITGTVTDGSTFTANLSAARASGSGAASLAGDYTLIFSGTNNSPQLPGGDGYGTVSVSTAGAIKLAATLADGTKLSQSAVATTDGEWPLYASLYSGQGEILGWLSLTNPPDAGIGGEVDWIKSPISNAKLYPGGFNFETSVIGSIYYSKASPLIGFNNGMVVLNGANLASPITNNVSVSATKVTNLSTNKLTLKLTSSKGTFTGSVVNPLTGSSIPFNGVFLQNEGFGAGDFLGGGQSGAVFFGPAN